jgi:hypothetical protein
MSAELTGETGGEAAPSGAAEGGAAAAMASVAAQQGDGAAPVVVQHAEGETPSERLQPTEVPDWAKDFDHDAQTIVANKKWQSPADVVKSYANLQSFSDKGDKVKWPTGDDDAEGWGEIYTKMGRPESAEGYELDEVPSGMMDLSPNLREWAFEEGLSQRQTHNLAGKFTELQVKMQEEAQIAETAQVSNDMAEVKGEWGEKFEGNMATAYQGTKILGLTEQQNAALEGIMGTKSFLETFHRIGRGLGEHGGGSGGGSAADFGMSPDQALVEIGVLGKDQDFQKARLTGDMDATKKWSNLHAIAYPGKLEDL